MALQLPLSVVVFIFVTLSCHVCNAFGCQIRYAHDDADLPPFLGEILDPRATEISCNVAADLISCIWAQGNNGRNTCHALQQSCSLCCFDGFNCDGAHGFCAELSRCFGLTRLAGWASTRLEMLDLSGRMPPGAAYWPGFGNAGWLRSLSM